jgi:hypothetical protein
VEIGRDSGADWLEASEALQRELQRTDRPWSCSGATVIVRVARRGSSQVEVQMPEGTSLQRHLPQASELLPTVEALLVVGRSAPLLTLSVPSTVVAPTPIDEHERPGPVEGPGGRTVAHASRPGPVVYHFDGELLLRLAGSPLYVTPGVRFGAGLRFGHWHVTANLQYESLSAALSDGSIGFSAETWTFGLGVAWAFALGRSLLSVGPTVAVLSSTIAALGNDDEIAQARVGLGLRWRSRGEGFALLLGAHADLSAGALFGSARDYRDDLPAPPTWGAGVSAGLTFGARP